MEFDLLRTLCGIHAPAGNEVGLKNFLIQYVNDHSVDWVTQPEIIYGDHLQDCFLLKFGKPTTAIYAHMDSIGFTVRYGNEVVKIGGPVTGKGIRLKGSDTKGAVDCDLVEKNQKLFVKFFREIDRGTELVFTPNWRETDDFVQCCYMDNRLGVWSALKVAESLENGVIAFSCWEEHGGGSVGYLADYCYEQWGIRQALISDITWVTEGVVPGEGVAISMRDRGIPRRAYIDRIIELAREAEIPFQLEVEGAGSSDGGYIQASHLPIDWCFIGAPEDHVHSPDEIVHKKDITSMVELYVHLMNHL